MRALLTLAALVPCLAAVGCARSPDGGAARAHAGLDSLNARLVQAYRRHDPRAYAALYTDTAVFEWPAVPTVRGAAGIADMALGNWSALSDMDLRLTIATRRVAPDHATEFGAFEQSWRDSSGVRRTEYGRYVTLAVRQADGSWRLDRFAGFADSTRPAPTAR